jgi:hypothetical protein
MSLAIVTYDLFKEGKTQKGQPGSYHWAISNKKNEVTQSEYQIVHMQAVA